MSAINYKRHVYEGWTVQDYIDELEPQITMIMNGQSWRKPFATREDLARFCTENQSYYKKPIPEVINHFARRYGL